MSRNPMTDGPGLVWHLTGRVNWRSWLLLDGEAYEIFIALLAKALHKFGVELVAFVVMSNHYHLVIRCPVAAIYRAHTLRRTRCRHFARWPRGHLRSTVVGQFAHWLKLAVAKTLQERLGITGHFWESTHHRRLILDAWALTVVVAYDHRNPLRAGMVLDPADYERSSAGWWLDGRPAPVPLLTRGELPFGLELEDFRSRVLALQTEKRLDDVMEALGKSGLDWDTVEGRQELERLMAEAGLDPLVCGHQSAD